MERRGIQKRFYLETRADVLLKNKEVFAYWRKLGLRYLFLGLEAIDAEGLKLHRKRVSMGTNNEALEVARSIGVKVAINLIADPSWDKERFAVVREWAMSIPDIVHLTVATPYPGTELWVTESRKLTTQDYRLFDIQHAVLPTTLPLHEFYSELVETQRVIARKHLGFAILPKVARKMGQLAMDGQFNFIKSIWKFNKVYNADRQFGDHQQPVVYNIRPPAPLVLSKERSELYIHPKPKRAVGAEAVAAPAE
jgi:magnesium-protoporphyrin IX monomethyl ester (oxidative) cyclase